MITYLDEEQQPKRKATITYLDEPSNIPTPKKTSRSLIDVATTPLVSKESILKNPASASFSSLAPISEFLTGIPRARPLTVGNLAQEGAETVSSQTSPAAIVGSLTALRAGGILPKIGIGKKLPQIMGKDYTLKRAQTLASDLKDLRSGYGSLKQDMISKVGNKAVDETKALKSISRLPQSVVEKFDDPIYEIERTSKGAFKPTIQNIDKMREAIGDLLSSRDWIEATKTSKGTLRSVFNELGNLMKETSPEVTSSLDAYSNFMKNIYRPAEKVIFKGGQVVEKPLRGAVKTGAERTTQQALEGLGKSVASSKQALKDMGKYTGRQALKGILGKGLLYGGIGGGLYQIGKKIVK